MTDSQSFEIKSARYGKAAARKVPLLNAKPFKHLSKNIVFELPPPGTTRWTVHSKAAVIGAIRTGALTLREACEQYALSTAEYRSWEAGFDALGLVGLGLAGRQLRRRALAHGVK